MEATVTVTPLVPWGSTDDHPQLVWRDTLDSRYLVEVQRTGMHTCTLAVFDHDNGDRLVMEADIRLSYAALFGPNAANVAVWREKVIEFIDSRGAP